MPNKKNTKISDILDTEEFYEIKKSFEEKGFFKTNEELGSIIEESEMDFDELSDLSAQEGGMVDFFNYLFGYTTEEKEPEFDNFIDYEEDEEDEEDEEEIEEKPAEPEPSNIEGGDFSETSDYNEIFNGSDNVTSIGASDSVTSKINSIINDVLEDSN